MKRAFTLIELLIVVAIIAILAAIAVPNFLEAQVRAKTSKCKADMRSIATAMEAYMVDANKYPFDRLACGYPWYLSDVLSTPIAYITNVSYDLFTVGSGALTANNGIANTEAAEFCGRRYRYLNLQSNDPGSPWHCCWTPTNKGYSGRLVAAPWACVGTVANQGDENGDYRQFQKHFGAWKLQSMGPDKIVNDTGNSFVNGNGMVYYDPTNGTVSNGDIILSSKGMK